MTQRQKHRPRQRQQPIRQKSIQTIPRQRSKRPAGQKGNSRGIFRGASRITKNRVHMSTALTIIDETVPPLRQSTFEQMGCPYSYGLIFIDGVVYPDSDPSMRGTELHAILAHYILHCARKRVPADFARIDELASSCGDESAMILTTCRDNLTVDWDNVFGVEMSMGLDEDFQPTNSVNHQGEVLPPNPIWN